MDTSLCTLSVLHPIIIPVIQDYLCDRSDTINTYKNINSYFFNSNSDSNEYGLCEELVKLGIPFNLHTYTDRWMDGEDQYYRFTSTGELNLKIVHQDFREPCLIALQQLKNDHLGLIYYIKKFTESVAEPSWDNQIEYGRVHRARILITR
jgi:hypothetical protein